MRLRCFHRRSIGLVVVLLAVFHSGCLGRRAAEVKQQVVGLDKRSLQRCLGTPAAVSEEEQAELWRFDLPYDGATQEIAIGIEVGPGTSTAPPTVLSGDVDRVRGARQAATDQNRIRPGSCRLIFRIRDGRVAAFRAMGRSFINMNADSECTMLAERCLPSPEFDR